MSERAPKVQSGRPRAPDNLIDIPRNWISPCRGRISHKYHGHRSFRHANNWPPAYLDTEITWFARYWSTGSARSAALAKHTNYIYPSSRALTLHPAIRPPSHCSALSARAHQFWLRDIYVLAGKRCRSMYGNQWCCNSDLDILRLASAALLPSRLQILSNLTLLVQRSTSTGCWDISTGKNKIIVQWDVRNFNPISALYNFMQLFTSWKSRCLHKITTRLQKVQFLSFCTQPQVESCTTAVSKCRAHIMLFAFCLSMQERKMLAINTLAEREKEEMSVRAANAVAHTANRKN